MFKSVKLSKKLIVFLSALVFVLVGTFVVLNRSSEPINPQQVIENSQRNEEGLPQAQVDIGEELATADKITVSGQTVNNIYKDRLVTTPQGDAMFFENDNYHFTYLPVFEKFIIYIKTQPVEENITLAEQDFLRALEINPDQACSLDVEVAVPFRVDEDYGGRNYPLSYCQ